MDKTDRQLDVWGIYRDPEHIYDALKIILEHKDKISTPLKLYKNCTSKFIVDGEEIGRYMSTFVCSHEADIALLLSNVQREKYISRIGEDGKEYDLEALATPEIIEAFFKKYGIPYETINANNEQAMVNDNEIPETWFARADYVLIDALRESHSKGCDECTFYPALEVKLQLDEQKNQYSVVFIKEDAKGDYKGFEWNRENVHKKGNILQIYRKEDSGFGEER